MSGSDESSPPTREQVLAFLEERPGAGAKRDIARALKVPPEHRAELRRILAELEAEGALTRTAKRAFAASDMPPPTGIVVFDRLDAEGDLFGRASGRDGVYGPAILFAGAAGRTRAAALGVGDRALCRIERGGDGVWRAKVIKKIDSEPSTSTVGVFRANRHGGMVEPTSRKDRFDYIVERADAAGAADGDLVRISVISGKGYGPRRARVIEVVGRADDPRAASLIAMHRHGVPDEFPAEVLAEAKAATAAEAPREDLTGLPLITIDPEDARDHDDAVFAEPSAAGGWRVIVAIADVSAYVRYGSALDREAYRRGNSTYFPDRVSPMLPESLSADRCSLREGEVRETMAVEMLLAADGSKRSHRFIRGRMRSAAKFSYGEAQAAIDGRPSDRARPLLERVLKPLWAAWRTADAARQRRAPLDLDLPERVVRLGEDGLIATIGVRERLEAHRLIEEFMILANVCAAETLEARRSPQVYRVHEEPSDEKIVALGKFLSTIDLSWAKGQKVTPDRFNRVLAETRGGENEHLVNEMVLRTQAQARYAPDNLGHFGLNLLKYAHFTSPIRRYSDLIIHRALIRALDLGPDGATDQELASLEERAEHVSMTERRSMAAEREATERYLAIFLADKVGAQFEGRISGVTRAGLFVKLRETGADGFVPAARISDEFWEHDEAHAALVARRSGRRYEMGMPVEVRLTEATPLTGGLLFAILTPPKPARRDLPPPRPGNRGGGVRQKRAADGGGLPPGIRRGKSGSKSGGKGAPGKGPTGKGSAGRGRSRGRG